MEKGGWTSDFFTSTITFAEEVEWISAILSIGVDGYNNKPTKSKSDG